MSTSSENRSEGKFEQPFGAIIGSILGVIAWLLFIVLYALYWSKGFDLFQDAIVTIASLLIMGLAIGAMWMIWFSLNRGSRQWWAKDNRSRIQKSRGTGENLNLGQRGGQVVSAVIILMILAFFVYNQAANTGFFTSKFGGWEMFAFYGSIGLGLVPPLARAAIGRRNPVRPVEAFCNLFSAFTCLWFFFVFPFNFAHFPDALPLAIRFAAAWVTNDIAKVVLILGFLGGMISAAYNVMRYFTFTQLNELGPTKKPISM